MRLALPEHRVDMLVSNYRWYMLLGFGLGAAAYAFDGFGASSAVMAIFLAASAGSLQRWRTEHGLWMLSALFFIFSFGQYCVFQFFAIMDLLRQPPRPWFLALDMAVATSLLWLQARFLFTVTQLNRNLARDDGDA